MFPLSDDNPTLRTPVVTIALLAITWSVWLLVQGAGGVVGGSDDSQLARSVCDYGLVPAELTKLLPVGYGVPLGRGLSCLIDDGSINYLTPVISIFLHGSWGHIVGNSLFLWVFGNNVEDSMGRGRFLLFYLLTGVVAAGAHILVDPYSPLPTVGASGAISGVMGAYLMLHPRARIRYFIPPFFFLRFPAWAALLFWFGAQVLAGLPQLSPLRQEISGGVAVWAHIGGFLAGVLLVRPFTNPVLVRKIEELRRRRMVWT